MSNKYQDYWSANKKIIAILLVIWFVVSFVLGIFIDWSGRFWFAQQGSIFVFVLLIFFYVVYMNKLDKRFGLEEEE